MRKLIVQRLNDAVLSPMVTGAKTQGGGEILRKER